MVGTWIVGIIVACMIGFAIYKIYKDRKTGKGCGCGCDGCSSCPKGLKSESTKKK